MSRRNLSDCVNSEELSLLFDRAFAVWRGCRRDPKGRRLSPRIPTGLDKPIFVDSYIHDGRRIALNRRARLADVSADGLGMVISEPLPVGAALIFMFDTQSGVPGHGVASVVSATRHGDTYRIGLVFTDTAQSLDIGLLTQETVPPADRHMGWRDVLERLRHAVELACRTVMRHASSRRKVRKHVGGRDVVFVVHARLFRYTAAIFVDGVRISTRSGILRDRLRNLFFENGRATVTYLEGGGCYASALLQPNFVTDCTLEVLPDHAASSLPTIPDVPTPSASPEPTNRPADEWTSAPAPFSPCSIGESENGPAF